MIAALYVIKNGPYYGLPDVDPWDEERDARLYNGPHPVVAHPPCQLWVNFASLNFKRWGGEHNRPGNDGGCFAAALLAVRRFGGVLEHPAGSRAWSAFNLQKPEFGKWLYGNSQEWVTEIWQSAYGHKARKRTWLLYRGERSPPPLMWEKPLSTHQIGWFDRVKPSLSKRQAIETPDEFKQLLLSIARSSQETTEKNSA